MGFAIQRMQAKTTALEGKQDKVIVKQFRNHRLNFTKCRGKGEAPRGDRVKREILFSRGILKACTDKHKPAKLWSFCPFVCVRS